MRDEYEMSAVVEFFLFSSISSSLKSQSQRDADYITYSIPSTSPSKLIGPRQRYIRFRPGQANLTWMKNSSAPSDHQVLRTLNPNFFRPPKHGTPVGNK